MIICIEDLCKYNTGLMLLINGKSLVYNKYLIYIISKITKKLLQSVNKSQVLEQF